DHVADMQQAIGKLEARLRQQPNDEDGWLLLGRAYQTTQRFAEARDAFKHALDLAPGNADVMLEYAQAMALATPSHRIDGAPRKLVERALATDPDNQRGLWLLGIGDYQDGNYEAAIKSWNRLLPQLQPGSDIARSVADQIADARSKLGEPPAGPAVASAGSGGAADAAATISAPETDNAAIASGAAPKLTVAVTLDPKLKDKLDPDATLFVFAKAASGPPMPLAIQRMSASKLPVTVTLDDSMGMLPSLKLSMFPQVVIGARISKSGNALPQSGDLQALSAPLDVRRSKPIALTIDQQVR
ncbi:MAG: tetratricopeptide repeat protein, partial [Rhodanobacteraceae bacterium]